MVNKVERKIFLGMDVRVVNGECIILKDMFGALGRVKEDGGWNNEKNKLVEFLDDIDKIEDYQTLGVLVKQGRIKTTQEVECLKLETVPMILTQFKPTERKGLEAYVKWKKFMIFVNDLLTSLEVHKYIITDKNKQKDYMEVIKESGGSCMFANNQVNTIMAKLIGVYPNIKMLKKEELKVYQAQTTVDLLDVREFVMSKFVNAYEFTGSHKQAGEMALKLANKNYTLDIAV